jgi:hypothetical protein
MKNFEIIVNARDGRGIRRWSVQAGSVRTAVGKAMKAEAERRKQQGFKPYKRLEISAKEVPL